MATNANGSDSWTLPDSWGTVVAAWRHTQQAFLTHRGILLLLQPIRPTDPSQHTGCFASFDSFVLGDTHSTSLRRHTAGIHSVNCIGDSRLLLSILIGTTCQHRQHMPEFICIVVACLQTRSSSSSLFRSNTRIPLVDLTHASFFFTHSTNEFFFSLVGTTHVPSLTRHHYLALVVAKTFFISIGMQPTLLALKTLNRLSGGFDPILRPATQSVCAQLISGLRTSTTRCCYRSCHIFAQRSSSAILPILSRRVHHLPAG